MEELQSRLSEHRSPMHVVVGVVEHFTLFLVEDDEGGHDLYSGHRKS